MAKALYSFLPTDVCFNVYRFTSSTFGFTLFKSLKYQDIIKSEIVYKSLDDTILTVEILDIDLIDDIFENENRQIMLERVYFSENDIDNVYDKSGKYNQYFYVNGATISFSQNDNIQQRTITLECFDFQKFFMRRIFHDQTAGYTAPITTYPDDFDKIKYPKSTFGEPNSPDMNFIVDFVYRRFVQKTTLNSQKGVPPGDLVFVDNLFLIDDYIFNGEGYDFDYYTTQDKKSTFDFLKQLFETAFDNNVSNIYRPFLKFSQNSNFLSLVVNGNKEITIDNTISRDVPILISKKIENIGIRNPGILTFAQQSGDNYASAVKGGGVIDIWFRPKYWNLDVEEDSANLENLDSALEQIVFEQVQADRVTSELEIEFNDLKFIIDFFVNDTLELVNFDKYVDGKYQIRQITEIIEDNYVTYSIDEMLELPDTMLNNITNSVTNNKKEENDKNK